MKIVNLTDENKKCIECGFKKGIAIKIELDVASLDYGIYICESCINEAYKEILGA